MDGAAYRSALNKYVKEAIQNGGSSNARVYEYLSTIKVGRFLVKNKIEKERALADACKAFDEHRHWPQDIVLSQLGLDPKEIKNA
jgi:hypothetical protein